MPHYTDGTQARAGDIVRGYGYNIKDDFGAPKEIVAIVLYVNEGAQACNVTVLIPDGDTGGTVTTTGKMGSIVFGQLEYGQTDHFEKIS